MSSRYSMPYDGDDPLNKITTGNVFVILLSDDPKRLFGCHHPFHVRTARDVPLGTLTSKAGKFCSRAPPPPPTPSRPPPTPCV